MTTDDARALSLSGLKLPPRHVRLLMAPASRTAAQWVGSRRAEWVKPACATLGELNDWILGGELRYLTCLPGVGRKMAGEIDAELERLRVPVDMRHTLQFGREP